MDRLEQRGLVGRERLTGNRRVVRIGITAAGLALLRRLGREVRDCHARQLGHLAPEQLATLTELLRVARRPHESPDGDWI